MHFAKIATAAVLAMGVSTFAVAQERASPSEPLNRSAPAANVGSDHDAAPQNPSASGVNRAGTRGATGGEEASRTAQRSQITEKNVDSVLKAHGYSDVKGVKRSGDSITANAKKDGKAVKVKVDTQTGQIDETRG
ncbi:MAG: PepSY domain-containing protein [Gemmatimonas sp.]